MKYVRYARYVLLALVIAMYVRGVAQETPEGVTIHVIQRGETLYSIAISYGVRVNDLARLNGIVNVGNIQIGQRLLVPTGEIDRPSVPDTHVVQPGETLRSIANFYGLSMEDVAVMNEIANPNTIYVGQKIRLLADSTPQSTTEVTETESAPAETVPPATPDTQVAPTATEPVIPTEIPPTAVTEESSNLIHVVQRGETLFRIAQQYGQTVNDLTRANSIGDPTLIYAGQRLIIPGYEAPEVAVDLPTPFTSIDVTPQTLVEGKTVRFRVSTAVPTLISGVFLGRELSIGSDETHTLHTILQGIPLFTEPGVYPLELVAVGMDNGETAGYSLNVQIVAGPYGREYIRLLAGRDGLLDPAVEQAELTLLENVTRPFTEPRYFEGQMGLPAAATIISPFGTRRSYNGGPFDRFHSGTDFAGAPGTPIIATAPGRVVLADTLNVRGLATVIDHGWGIYTGYWHQSQQNVQVGDVVTTGQVIGTIGSTGRVTGAHLHWELWVGGVPVDPMQWVQFAFL